MTKFISISHKDLKSKMGLLNKSFTKVLVVNRYSRKQCTKQNFDDFFNMLTYFKEIEKTLELDLSDDYIPDSYMSNIVEFMLRHKNI